MEGSDGKDLLLVSQEAGITTVTLNRPAMRNPISDQDMIEAIVRVFSEADADPDTRVVILTGAGKAFSTGGNLHAMKPGGSLVDAQPVRTRQNYRNGIQRLPLLFDRLEVPVIAAVNGAAIGAGCDLACMCDIRIAAESARFAESFVKLGLIPGDGGAWLLPQVVGYSKACELAFTGDMLDARAALACGLVSQVVPDDDLMNAARDLAGRMAANSTQAVRMTKRLMREARQSSLSAILEMSGTMQAAVHQTPEHIEAVARFLGGNG